MYHFLILRKYYVHILHENAEKEKIKSMDSIALILIVIGALNWGLIGIFQFDVVAAIFGGMSTVVSRIIYTLVGLAGIWGITMLFRKENKASLRANASKASIE